MRRIILNLIFILSISIWLCSCAGTYKALSPPTLSYSSYQDQNNDVVLQYSYHPLSIRGNKKYAKKEAKSFVNLVAVKITNNTDKSIKVSEDLQFYMSDQAFIPLEKEIVYNNIKQLPGFHLFYLLLTPLEFFTIDEQGERNSIPVGYVIGPGLALGNFMVGSQANKNLKSDLEIYDIYSAIIPPGEYRYGLIGVSGKGSSPLSVKRINKSN